MGQGIYIASKCRHAEKWKQRRAAGVNIISSWLDESEPGQSKSLADLWSRNVKEAAGAAALVFYVEPGETMKGALVELGAALAAGVPVYSFGLPEGSTFSKHPLVTECGSIKIAFDLAVIFSTSEEDNLTRLRNVASEAHELVCKNPGRKGYVLDREEAHAAVDEQLRKMGRIR